MVVVTSSAIRRLWSSWRRRPSERTPWLSCSLGPSWSWRWRMTSTARISCWLPLNSMVRSKWRRYDELKVLARPMFDSLCISLFRDQDHGGVSGHGEACQEIPATGEFPGGGDGGGLQVHHFALHSEAEFQRAGRYPEITCLHWHHNASPSVYIIDMTIDSPLVGPQHPGQEGWDGEDSLWRSRPRRWLSPPPRFEMGPETGELTPMLDTCHCDFRHFHFQDCSLYSRREK